MQNGYHLLAKYRGSEQKKNKKTKMFIIYAQMWQSKRTKENKLKNKSKIYINYGCTTSTGPRSKGDTCIWNCFESNKRANYHKQYVRKLLLQLRQLETEDNADVLAMIPGILRSCIWEPSLLPNRGMLANRLSLCQRQ